MSKKKKTIFFAIVAGVILIFMIDELFRNGSTNPLEAGRGFSFAYMNGTPELMKGWAHKSAHNKIDQLHLSPIAANIPGGGFSEEDLLLVCFRRLADTIVATYCLPFTDDSTLLYTVVLRPRGSRPSLWERCKYFFGISPKPNVIPLLRWLVTDFYTEDNGIIRKYQEDFIRFMRTGDKSILNNYESAGEQQGDWTSMDVNELRARMKELFYESENKILEWSEKEKVQQNKEMRRLYTDYWGLHNNNGDSSSVR